MSPSGISQNPLGATLLAVTWILFAMSFVVVGLRLYSDMAIVRLIRLDSYIISFTFVFATISQVFTTMSVSLGMGKHIDDLSNQNITMSLKFIWFAQSTQLFVICMGKLAVVAYLTTINGPSYAKTKRALLWTIGSLQLAAGIVNIIIIFSQCSPAAKLWNENLKGSCNGRLRNKDFAYFTGSLSASSDIFLVIFPIFIFWNLRMRLTRKITLCVLFAFGTVASMCAIIKTTNLKRTAETSDVTNQLPVLVIWNATEMYIVLLAGSVPPLSPFFTRHFGKSSIHHHRGRDRSAQDDEIELTLAAAPNGRTETFASAMGKKSISNACSDSTEDILTAMGQGDILMTTRINVSRGN